MSDQKTDNTTEALCMVCHKPLTDGHHHNSEPNKVEESVS